MSFPTGLVMRPSEFTETFTDTFTRANSSTVGNGWLDFGGDPAGPWEINTNRLLRNDATGGVQDGIVRPVLVVDGYAECIPKHEEIGPCVRVTGTGDGYNTYFFSGNIVLEHSGGFALDSVAETLDLTSDVLRIDARDNVISVYKNGTLLMSQTHTTWLSGHRGVIAKPATGDLAVDNFACGE